MYQRYCCKTLHRTEPQFRDILWIYDNLKMTTFTWPWHDSNLMQYCLLYSKYHYFYHSRMWYMEMPLLLLFYCNNKQTFVNLNNYLCLCPICDSRMKMRWMTNLCFSCLNLFCLQLYTLSSKSTLLRQSWLLLYYYQFKTHLICFLCANDAYFLMARNAWVANYRVCSIIFVVMLGAFILLWSWNFLYLCVCVR